MDLEQAMERILELTEKNKELENMITSYELKDEENSRRAEKDSETITHLKELNMKYFTKLTMEKENTVKENESIEDIEVEQKQETKVDFDEWLKSW